MSLTADYRIPVSLTSLKNIIIGANVVGSVPVYWDAANIYKQDFYAVVGAHATLDFGTVSLDLWGRNLTDTGYGTFYFVSINHGFVQQGRPRQVGATLRYFF